MHPTHDGHAQRAGAGKRYAPEARDEASAPDDWIAALFGARTVGEVADIVTDAKNHGVFDERDLRWARAYWAVLAGDRSLPAAIALVRKELGAVEVAS
jgi:hypothetical protein